MQECESCPNNYLNGKFCKNNTIFTNNTIQKHSTSPSLTTSQLYCSQKTATAWPSSYGRTEPHSLCAGWHFTMWLAVSNHRWSHVNTLASYRHSSLSHCHSMWRGQLITGNYNSWCQIAHVPTLLFFFDRQQLSAIAKNLCHIVPTPCHRPSHNSH